MLKKSLGERNRALYLLFNKIPSPEIQNLCHDESLSWLRIQTSSSGQLIFLITPTLYQIQILTIKLALQ